MVVALYNTAGFFGSRTIIGRGLSLTMEDHLRKFKQPSSYIE